MNLFCGLLSLKIPEHGVQGNGSSWKEGRDEHCDGDDCEEYLCSKVLGIVQGSLKETHLRQRHR